MSSFFALLMKNITNQIKERPFYFFLINLSLSVGLFCTLFFLEFILQTNTGKSINLKNMDIESVIAYLFCIIAVISYTMINIISLYRYLNNENKKRHIIYKMYGCKKTTLFLLSFFEFNFYSIISSIIGIFLFYLTNKLRLWIGLVEHYQVYCGVLVYYTINIVCISYISYTVSKIRIVDKERL